MRLCPTGVGWAGQVQGAMGMNFTRTGLTVQMHGWYLQERKGQLPGLWPFKGKVGARRSLRGRGTKLG